MSKIQSIFLGSYLAPFIRANSVQWPRADLDPRADESQLTLEQPFEGALLAQTVLIWLQEGQNQTSVPTKLITKPLV